MEKLLISLLLAFLLFAVEPGRCQSVESVCRFRISGTFPHPNPQRCDLFVQCFMFQAIVRECPGGTIFSNAGNQCVPGDRDTCTVQNPPATTTIATTTTTGTLNVCEGINLGAVPIPGDCTRYILCVLGVGELISCGNNEVFDQTEGRCVPGNPLTCEVFTTTLATTSSTSAATTSTSSTPPPTTTSSSASSPTTPLPPPIGNVCAGNNFRYVANPRSCYRFFYCLFGAPVPGECFPNTIFIEAQQSCVAGDRTTCIPFMMGR